MEKMLIIDNCVGSFGNQVANGIPIFPFKGDRHDVELPLLVSHIRRVTAAADMLLTNAASFAVADIRFCKDASHYLASLTPK